MTFGEVRFSKSFNILQICYYERALWLKPYFTAKKMKFSIEDFYCKCDQIRRKLRIWSHLLKKSLMINFIFCVVFVAEN